MSNGTTTSQTSDDEVTFAPGYMLAPGVWWQGRCRSCRKFHTWRGIHLIYPMNSVIPLPRRQMPDRAKTLYLESREVAKVSKRAGAAMARATLEVLLRTLLLDAPNGSRLEELTVLAEPQVSVGLATRLHVVRETGNKSVHPKLDPADESELLVLVLTEESDDMIAMLFDTVNRVVDEMIVEKAQNDRFAALIPDGVMEGIERTRKRLLKPPAHDS